MKNLTMFIFIILLFVAVSFTVIASIGVEAEAEGLDSPTQTQGTSPFNASEQEPAIYEGDVKDNPINQWIQFALNVLTVVIIAGSAVMIAIAGIQYTTSRDNSQAVQAAKDKLWNITLGLLFYLFLYAFAQWLVPGGIF